MKVNANSFEAVASYVAYNLVIPNLAVAIVRICAVAAIAIKRFSDKQVLQDAYGGLGNVVAQPVWDEKLKNQALRAATEWIPVIGSGVWTYLDVARAEAKHAKRIDLFELAALEKMLEQTFSKA